MPKNVVRGDDEVAVQSRPAPDSGASVARPRWWHAAAMLGPAFVAAIAYVDPGNVAANLTSGAQYGYLLVWVLVLANLMAMLIQFQSAKLGIVTGRTLPEHVGARARPATRRAYWLQAEVVAAATDIAEVIGGAIALNLLFGLPLVVGGLVVGLVSMGLLLVQSARRQRTFEFVIIGLLAVIAIGFLAGTVVSPVDWPAAANGLVPRFEGAPTVLLAASMLGATVMPHAIYLHSALARDRHHAAYARVAERSDFTGRDRRAAAAASRSAPAPASAPASSDERMPAPPALGLTDVVRPPFPSGPSSASASVSVSASTARPAEARAAAAEPVTAAVSARSAPSPAADSRAAAHPDAFAPSDPDAAAATPHPDAFAPTGPDAAAATPHPDAFAPTGPDAAAATPHPDAFAPAPSRLRQLLRATRGDVLIALLLAGVVNIAMLLLAASSLRGVAGTDTIPGAYAAIDAALGPVIATIFAIGLLASGLASTSVGAYAGSVIMKGLLTIRVPILLRRVITLIPALAVLAAGIDPTWALVLSQVLLSVGIPFALIPLIRLTGDRRVMGDFADRMPVRIASWTVATLIVALNVVLIVLTITGAA
jgi:Mn2+/Fe2+ NRAMP family transporter